MTGHPVDPETVTPVDTLSGGDVGSSEGTTAMRYFDGRDAWLHAPDTEAMVAAVAGPIGTATPRPRPLGPGRLRARYRG